MKLIAIDAGHGGKDPGALGNGFKEKDIVLNLSLKLDRELKRRNYRTILTRNNDKFISLQDRTSLANKNNADLLISLHTNAFSNPSANGYETFFHKNSKNGKRLATLIQKRLAPLYKSNRGIKNNNLHITRESKMVAVLLELGFITNINDMNVTLGQQDKIISLIADAVDEYFGKQPVKKDKEERIKPMYRVRKSWNNPKSQLGAYTNLDNAKQLADKNAGYYVFDEKGKAVYPVKHWADKHFDYLNSNGIEVKQKRFNDHLKRGEALALLHRLHESLVGRVEVKPENKPEQIPNSPTEEKPKPPIIEQPKQPVSPFKDKIVEKKDDDITLVYVPFDEILELRVAINGASSQMLTAKEMQSRYGFDYLINGGFFSYSKSINTVFDGRNFETSGDFSKFTMLVKRNIVEWGEFYRGNNTGAIGGSPSLIKSGKIDIDHSIGHENERHPRSAVGATDDGVIFLTVDGRTNGKGATLKELADYMWNLGITNAINLDGGRSTILMKKDEVLNKHLEDRKIHNALGIWLKE